MYAKGHLLHTRVPDLLQADISFSAKSRSHRAYIHKYSWKEQVRRGAYYEKLSPTVRLYPNVEEAVLAQFGDWLQLEAGRVRMRSDHMKWRAYNDIANRGTRRCQSKH